MNPPKLFTVALSLALFPFATDSAFALSPSSGRGNSRGRGNTQPEPPKINAGDATIEHIGSLSISVKSGKTIRSYGIDDHTKILVANVRASAGTLRKGMRVSVHPSTLNPTMAQSIEVDDPSIKVADASKTAARNPAASKKPANPKKK